MPDKAIAALEDAQQGGLGDPFRNGPARIHRRRRQEKGRRSTKPIARSTEKKQPNTRIAEAFARHLAFWGDGKKRSKRLSESGADTTPLGKALLAELKAGKTPKLMVSTAEEGLAESFLGIGQVLAANNGVDAAQIYLRLALFLNPASDIAKLELAELYGNLEQYDKAISVIDGIREGSPFWINSRVRKALYLNALQKDGRCGSDVDRSSGEQSKGRADRSDARFH